MNPNGMAIITTKGSIKDLNNAVSIKKIIAKAIISALVISLKESSALFFSPKKSNFHLYKNPMALIRIWQQINHQVIIMKS